MLLLTIPCHGRNDKSCPTHGTVVVFPASIYDTYYAHTFTEKGGKINP